MSKFYIKKLIVRNFKAFDEFELNFNDSKVVVLGGPNGFGKTTIFDALELALTGNIQRLIPVERSTGSNDNLVARDQDKNVEIELCLVNDGDTIRIKRTLTPEKLKSVNKISNFSNLWKLEKIDTDSIRPLEQKEFEILISELTINRHYNNFFYVQQENTSHFLKQNEQERLKLFTILFDIEKESLELKKLENLKKHINETVLQKLKNQIESMSSVENSSQIVEDNKVDYKPLFKVDNRALYEWDKQIINFPETGAKDKYLNEVQRIKYFVQNYEQIIKYIQSSYINKNIDKVKVFIFAFHWIDKRNEIMQLWQDKGSLLSLKVDLLNIDTLIDGERPNLDLLQNHDKESVSSFEDVFDLMKELKSQMSKSKIILEELINLRKKVLKKFDESELSPNDCPLCGFEWPENKLLDAIEEKTKFLIMLANSEEESYQENLNKLEELKEKLVIVINLLLDSRYKINDNYLEIIKNITLEDAILNKFHQFLQENEVHIDDLIVKNLDANVDDLSLNELSNKLLNRLNEKLTFEGSLINLITENNLADVYMSYFDKNIANVSKLNVHDVDQKYKYVELMFYKHSQEKYSLLQKLRSKKDMIVSTLLPDIDRLKNIYTQSISLHRKKMISHVEIPFYIYSGKILHNIKGVMTSGVFIKDPVQGNDDKLNNIRIVSNYASDQDIINTTSSGQLAGIVIALTLTLNKIYSRGLNSIFIDDPVQAMDDINMISLVELIRNDFRDKQIFISSHEADVEKYILYKFMKYKSNVCRVNVMTKEISHKKF